jgi:hypothetical protein
MLKLLLMLSISTVLITSSWAKDDSTADDQTSGQSTPGVNEPRTPDTLKPNADERIRTEGLNSERSQEKLPAKEKPSEAGEPKK